MTRIHVAFAALAVTLPAAAQLPLPPSNFPRVHSVADNYSPTAVARFHMKVASPKQLLPAQGTLPTTASFVACVYGDTQNFAPQFEFKYSTSGGYSWSDPTVIHKFLPNEITYNNHEVDQLVCDGRNIFWVFWSNRFNVSAGSVYAVYVYGSNDMGQTWQGPLVMSPGIVATTPTWKAATPELDAVAAGGRLHVVFEANRITNTAGNEEVLYSNATFDTSGKFVLGQTDVDISQMGNPTTADANAPRIDADGSLVAIVWVDNRARNSVTGHEAYVRVSRDGGTKFDPEVDVSTHSKTSSLATSGDASRVAVSNTPGGGSIYCTYQDMRNNPTVSDNLFLMFSKDGGAKWNWNDNKGARIRLNANTVDDVDGVLIAADGGAVAVSWFDEIPPVGTNNANQLRVIVDPLGGIGWTTGIIPPIIDLSKNYGVTDVQHLESMEMTGRFIGIAHEVNSPEAAAMSWSCDLGKTWMTRIANDGKVDVDEPSCSVSLNGDFNLIYLEDRAGGQSNTTVVTGLKTPTIANDLAASQGIKVTCAMGSVGYVAMALFSGTPADMKSNKPLAFNNTGFSINLTADIAYSVGISVAFSQPAVYFGTVDAKGEVAFPGIANLSSLLGVSIYTAVATAQTITQLGEFTDPVKLR